VDRYSLLIQACSLLDIRDYVYEEKITGLLRIKMQPVWFSSLGL